MKIIENKKLLLGTLLIGLFMHIALFAAMFKPVTVYAVGPQCYIYVQSMYFRATTCPANSSIDPNNNSSQTLTCYFIADVSLRQGRSNYTTKNCLEMLQVNQACVNTNCIPGASADGTGASSQDPSQSLGAPGNPDRSAIVDCNGNTAAGAKQCLEHNPLVKWTLIGINFLAAGAGIIIAVSIVVAGIQYASSGSNPQQVAAAKSRIISAIVALLAFFFLYAFLQWLVPGGIF